MLHQIKNVPYGEKDIMIPDSSWTCTEKVLKVTRCGREKYLHVEDHAVSVLPQWQWCYRWHKSTTQSHWCLWASSSQVLWWPWLWKTELSHCFWIWIIKDNIGVKRPETNLKDWTLIFLHQPPSVIEKWLCRLRFGSHLGRTVKEVKTLLIPYRCGLGECMKIERDQTFSYCKEYPY